MSSITSHESFRFQCIYVSKIFRTALKARNEEVISAEKRLQDRTESLERDTKIRQAEVRADFSRYEQEAARREDLSMLSHTN